MATAQPIPDQAPLALPNGGEAMLRLRRSDRARHMMLRIIPATGEPELVLPRRTPLGTGLAFARDKAGWLQRQLDAIPPPVPFADGAKIPLRGKPVTIRREDTLFDDIWLSGNTLHVAAAAPVLALAVRAWFRGQARAEFGARSRRVARTIGCEVRRVVVRDTMSRWGSCSPSGHISYSWRLILAPDYVIDYIVAHEVAHLQEFNHGSRFWALVDRLTDHAGPGRAWLREEGGTLHRYGLEPRS